MKSWVDVIMRILWGSPEGTIRRKGITPKEAIENNKDEIESILKNTELFLGRNVKGEIR